MGWISQCRNGKSCVDKLRHYIRGKWVGLCFKKYESYENSGFSQHNISISKLQ